jgi:DnaB-like helicase N terminal domain
MGGEPPMKRRINPAIRAEQALLGSVLADPGGQGWLLDLVNASDLIRPYHAQVLAAMNRLRGRGAAPGAVAVREEIRTDPDLPSSVSANAVLLADLMEAAPNPEHGPAYGAMVISTGIRRQMALAASRMRQAAEDGNAAIALRMARRVRAEAARCQARWDVLPEPMRREVPLLPRHGERAPGRPAGPEAEEAGARALRDLVAAPSQLEAVRGWLRPGHFARADHGELYSVILAMADAGMPIDPVTVSWEAARREVVVDAADLADGDRPFAVTSAREVRRQGVLAQAACLAGEIEASTDTPALTPEAFLERAAGRLGRLGGGAEPDHARAANDSSDQRACGPVRGAVRDRDASREAAS